MLSNNNDNANTPPPPSPPVSKFSLCCVFIYLTLYFIFISINTNIIFRVCCHSVFVWPQFSVHSFYFVCISYNLLVFLCANKSSIKSPSIYSMFCILKKIYIHTYNLRSFMAFILCKSIPSSILSRNKYTFFPSKQKNQFN